MLAGSALDDALNVLAWSLDAADDVHASARYRRELVRRLGKQTVSRSPGGAAMKRLDRGEPPSGGAHPQRSRGERAGPSRACY